MPHLETIAVWRSEIDAQRVAVFEGDQATEQAHAFLIKCAQESDNETLQAVKTWDELLTLETLEDIAVDVYDREDGATGEVYKW